MQPFISNYFKPNPFQQFMINIDHFQSFQGPKYIQEQQMQQIQQNMSPDIEDVQIPTIISQSSNHAKQDFPLCLLNDERDSISKSFEIQKKILPDKNMNTSFIGSNNSSPKSQKSFFNKFQKKPNRSQDLIKIVMAKSYQINFVKNLLQRNYLNKPTFYQNEILDDLKQWHSVTSQIVEKSSFIQKLKNRLSLPVLEPFSKLILIWDIQIIIVILFAFFWLPFKLSFEISNLDQLFWVSQQMTIEKIILAIMVIDMCFHSNIAYIYHGNIVRKRKSTITRYIKTQFSMDLISLITAMITLLFNHKEMFSIQTYLILTLIFIISRFQRLNKIIEQIEEYLNSKGIQSELINLIDLIQKIIFICHIFACVWHGIAYYNSGITWLTYYDLSSQSIGSRYNYSFYWAAMTMVTVGYGDITPKNDIELACANLTMFLACGVFAFSVNSIGIMVQKMYKNQIEYKQKVQLINGLMIKTQIRGELQHRIRSYLEYIWQEEKEMEDKEVNNIVEKLSKNLQEELQFEIRGNILKNCKVFEKFSTNLIMDSTKIMEEVRFSPEDEIISENYSDDSAIYIITKGKVDICFQPINFVGSKVISKTYSTLKSSTTFGEISFFTAKTRSATAISNGFTKLYKIKRKDFLQLLQQYPTDFEEFQKIKDQILLYNQFDQLKIKCYSCQNNNHIIKNCPLMYILQDQTFKN